MNEHELKSALQDVMVASSPPPPMDPAAALRTARRAQRRRQATWGGLVAGLAVVGIAVGAVLVPNPGGGGMQVGGQVGGLPSPSRPHLTDSPTPERPSVTPTRPLDASVPPSGDKAETGTSWPSGQTDRTATNGPRADKSVALLNDLAASLPAGVKAEDRTRIGFADYGPMRGTQSQFADYAGEVEVWEYLAFTPVVRPGEPGVGKLWIQVETKGNSRVGNLPGCGLAVGNPYPTTGDGRCDLVPADGKEVPVITADASDPHSDSLEQAAFFRHPDGTLVVVGQAKSYKNSGHPELGGQPLTPQQLAALAADPKFHLD